MTDSARIVWREGFAPNFTVPELVALRDGLRDDDQRLTQGSTTTPPPLMCVQDWPVEAGCANCYPFAMVNGGFVMDSTGHRVENPAACSVGRCEERFAGLCHEADELMGEPAAARHFLNWYDETPRDEMRRELLAEVERSLIERGETAPSPSPTGAN